MGGGDLNLKKSWHPHTMKNQEKVWKAEQAKNAEDRKMNDLRKEIQEEKNREELVKIGQATGILSKSDDKKLEWMYKSSAELINREEYLLGRPIDKAFETLAAEENQREKELVGVKVPANHVEHECIPFSIRAYRNAATTEQVDLQRKILEDPLMMIKQKEMESRRKILENPVKLKELHRILKTEKSNKSKCKSSQLKKSKKSKKLKKKYRKSDSDDSSDKDLDKMLQKQYKKLKGSLDVNGKQLAGLDLSKLLDAKYKTISKELDKAAQSKRKKRKSKKSAKRNSFSSNTSESDSDEDLRKRRNERNGNGYGIYTDRTRSSVDRRGYREERRRYSPTETKIYPQNKNTHTGKNVRKSRSQSPRRKKRSESRSRQRGGRSTSRSPQKKEWREDRSTSQQKKDRRRDRSKSRSLQIIDQKRNRYRSRSIQKKHKRRDRSKSDSLLIKDRSSNKTNYSQSLHIGNTREMTSHRSQQKKKRLTEEEKEKRLKDMMENAAWHDKERTQYVQKYRDGYKQEEEQNKARDFDKQFINTQLRKAISTHNSVESRIRSNVNNIQRTSAAMNANFAKK